MNILYIVHDNKKGGAALSFLEMISHVKERHNVFVFVPHKQGFVPEQLEKMKIPYQNAHYFWWKIALPFDSLAAGIRKTIYKMLNAWNIVEAKRLNKKIRQMDIDIIHSNSSVINFGALLSKETGIPHVWHLREYGEEDFNLKCVVSSKQYEKEMNCYAVGYIAISKSIKEKFSNVVNQNNITHIYNGVSENFCLKKDFLNKENEEVRFLISGNYCREKGQIDAVLAAVELCRQGITDFKLYLAGNGDFAEPQKVVIENHLEDQIIFCGCVEDMLELRKTVDVEIVASKCEAFGRVTIEAMRMSNPVIGTNTGGTPELICNGRNGFLFEYGNHLQLAEYMGKFITDRKLIAQMGKNAFCDMNGAFTPKENAGHILALYEQIRKQK